MNYIKQTQSTNQLLRELLRETDLPEGYVIRTDFQTAGKGQPGNSWESETGKNLLFSILLYPEHISLNEHFIVSQLVSLSIINALNEFAEGFCIKWPNDIYYFDKKIAGILIENSLQGTHIKSSVIGIGLNINQKAFVSNAPNPISLCCITGKRMARKPILNKICKNIQELYRLGNAELIRKMYFEKLYRNSGFYTYKDETGLFEAKIKSVQPDGKLELITRQGETRSFYFKEVSFVNPNEK